MKISIPIGIVNSPFDLNVIDKRLLVPKMSSKKPTSESMIANTTRINITLKTFTMAGVRHLNAVKDEILCYQHFSVLYY